jgi:hypothetical protein
MRSSLSAVLRLRLFPVLVPALALAAGCDPVLFSAELDAPEVCISGLEVPFPPSGYTGDTDRPINSGMLGVPQSKDFDLNIEVTSIRLAPTSGVSDLDFVHELRVSAVAAGPAAHRGDEVTLIEMDDSSRMDDGSMFAEPEVAPDIADLLMSGDVIFRFDLSGELPDDLWRANMDLCAHAVAQISQPL